MQQAQGSILKGLQELNREQDVRFFEEWGSQTSDYVARPGSQASWIWRIAMQPDSDMGGGLEQLTASWEREGYLICYQTFH